jgi:nucleotide-binding universal stress UspA family protein
MENILVVLDGSDSDEVAVAQAVKIIDRTEGRLHLLMAVYDQIEEMHKYVGFDNYKDIKQSLLDSAETKLRLLTDQFNISFSSGMTWGKRWYRPVVDKARKMEADLIIKVAGDKQSRLVDFLQTPEDWHLLRDASCPLWLIGEQNADIQEVIAAVSTLDEGPEHRALDERVIGQAQRLASALSKPLWVVSVLPDFDAMAVPMAYVPPVAGEAVLWHETAAEARARSQQKLELMLDRLRIQPDRIEMLTGRVDRALAEIVGTHGLLVIGSAANRGLAGKFIGNSSERVLRYLKADMLVVH